MTKKDFVLIAKAIATANGAMKAIRKLPLTVWRPRWQVVTRGSIGSGSLTLV